MKKTIPREASPRDIVALLICSLVSACGGGASTPQLERSSRAVVDDKSPAPDLCGTWESVELSVTAPPPSASRSRAEVEVSDAHTFCRSISVRVPDRLEVVGDASPETSATLSFAASDGPPRGRALDTCRYRAERGRSPRSGLVLESCTRGLKAGTSVIAQTFFLAVRAHSGDAPAIVRVALGNGTPPPAGAAREILGTTSNLAGVVLRVPANVPPFAGIGLADGPPFELHDFVSDPPSGSFVVGPSLQVTGPASLPPGVRLTVPFDAAWAAGLPAGSTSTVALKRLQQASVPLGAIDAVPLDASVGASTLETGLDSPGAMLVTIRDLTPITFHDGALMNNGVRVYISWVGDFAAMAKTDDPRQPIRRFLADLSGSAWYDILGTYGITNRNVQLAGEQERKNLTRVSDPYTDVVKPALDDGTFAQDVDGIYLVVMASNATFPGYCSKWCGWHSSATSGDDKVKYAIIGSPVSCGGCRTALNTPNGSAVDGVISTVAHELVETVTNPTGGGWFGYNEANEYGKNVENADKCNWIYLSTESTGTPSTTHDMANNGNRYLIQSNWVRAEGGYCGMGIESVQIAATPPAGGLALNQVGHFSVTVTNTGPVRLNAGTLTVQGGAIGVSAGSAVPVRINQDLAPNQSVTVDVPVAAPLDIFGNVQSVEFDFTVRDPRNLHTFDAVGRTFVDVRRADVLLDEAKCVGISLPSTVTKGTLFPVTVTLENTGSTVWLAGEYRLVGWPLDVVNGYLQTPLLIGKTVDRMQPVTLTFSASADVEWGETYHVTVGMANAARAFTETCSGSTTVSLAGKPCKAGTGACRTSGVLDAAGNCSAVPRAPNNNFHDAPETSTASWDWNCDGQDEQETTRVCSALRSHLDPGNPGLCVWEFPLEETTNLGESCIGIDNCGCVENAVPGCGQVGSFSSLVCQPGDPICIDLMCSQPSPAKQRCR
jgi:hypothetical protein